MRIGILTFVNTTNYGAALQAFALQQSILSYGHECQIIRYINRKVDESHNPRAVFKRKGLKRLIAPFLYYVYSNRKKRFLVFEKDYCDFSKTCVQDNVSEVLNQYDRIVVGSDQVWNPDISGDDMTYFLDCLSDDKKKYSYAASIGTGYFSDNLDSYEKLINRFQVISVREWDTAARIKKVLQREDTVCDVDPTFLLFERWKNFVNDVNPFGDYIFLYLCPETETLLNAVRRFAAKKGCKIILLKKGIGKHKKMRIVNVASPIDFINYIAHAKYVIAGSFHAICFSLMLKKEFYVTSAIEKKRNSRLISLLETYGLKSRMLSEPDFVFDETHIDYSKIKQIISENVKRSKKTIERICEF